MPVFCILLAILILFPVKPYANLCPCSKIPTESWRKTRYLTHLWTNRSMKDQAEYWLLCNTRHIPRFSIRTEVRMSIVWGKASGSKRGQLITVTFKSRHHKNKKNLQWCLCSHPRPLRKVCSSSFYFTMAFLPGTKKSPNRTKSKGPTH